MHNLKLTIFAAIVLLISGGFTSANAQLQHGYSLKAYIPYDFTVQDKRFPAGEYKFSRIGVNNPASTLMMRGENGDKIIFQTIRHRSLDGYQRTQLVFDRVDGRHFLSTIKLEGQFTGYEIPVTRTQRQLVSRARNVDRVVVTSGGAL